MIYQLLNAYLTARHASRTSQPWTPAARADYLRSMTWNHKPHGMIERAASWALNRWIKRELEACAVLTAAGVVMVGMTKEG